MQAECQLAVGTFGMLNIVDQNHISVLCPDGGQETKVVPQLTSGVWSREIGKAACQYNVVLGVKYVYCHSFSMS